jgi:GxxExxY protein
VRSDLRKIEKIAKDVYRALGSGYPEEVYDKAMQVGLRLAGIRYENQRTIEITYKGHHVGTDRPDLIVNLGKGKVIVELKATNGELGIPETRQLKNYMRILKIKRGLLINFQQPGRKEGKTKIEIKEV